MFNWFKKNPLECQHDWENIDGPYTLLVLIQLERNRRNSSVSPVGKKYYNIPIAVDVNENALTPMKPKQYHYNRVCLKCGYVDNTLDLAREEAIRFVDDEEWRRQKAKWIWEESKKGPSE